MAEPIEIPFGLWTGMEWVEGIVHVFDGSPRPSTRRDDFDGGKGRPIVKYKDSLR